MMHAGLQSNDGALENGWTAAAGAPLTAAAAGHAAPQAAQD
jgi:hypothetical protein